MSKIYAYETPKAIITEFPDQRSFLLKEIAARDEKIIHLDQENHSSQRTISWFKRQIFGKRSEREVSDLNAQQLLLKALKIQLKRKKRKKL